jgi:hypothetical protein
MMMKMTKSNTNVIYSILFLLVIKLVDNNNNNNRARVNAINPDLSFADINLMVVSDVHAFVGGHPHEEDRNADFGDLLSFHQRLKEYCNNNQQELFLLNNGNWVHGTGLAMDGNASSLLPIMKSIPWDGINLGNHEGMYSAVLHDMKESLLPALPGAYVTSNVIWKESSEPYGERYQLLKGGNSTVLLFGFVKEGHSFSELIDVTPIADAVQQDWFFQALTQTTYDAIVVMAHMDNDDPHLDVIYDNIRPKIDSKMPIQFITGHTFERRYKQPNRKDVYHYRMQPGGLFDTIGWANMPSLATTWAHPQTSVQEKIWKAEFLNTNKQVLHDRLGLDENEPLRTPEGEQLSAMIQSTQKKLGLDQVVACPGNDFLRNTSMHADNSLWKLWKDHVVPSQLFEKGADRLMLVSKGTLMYDLRGSGRQDSMTLDDVVAIAPYMNHVVFVGEVPDWMVRRLNNTLNTLSAHKMVPDFVLAGDIESYQTVESYELYTYEVDLPAIHAKLEKYNYQDYQIKRIGKRDTLYWLDYVMAAFPCEGTNTNKFSIVPYFYDPSKLEEEKTDGSATGQEDSEDEQAMQDEEDNGEEWTLPPGGYSGYLPGQGEAHKIPPSHYANYEGPKEEGKKVDDKKTHHSDVKARIQQRKKRQKKIVKGFALTVAFSILLIPVVCGVMQLTGRWKDDDDDMVGMYDREEVKALRRHRRRGHTGVPLRNMRPTGEIEIT